MKPISRVLEVQFAELEQEMNFLPILGHFSYDPVVVDADFHGKNLFDLSKRFVQEAEKIKWLLL